jgi:hemolysin activation/secretion protein
MLGTTDVESGYGELAVRWDSRRPVGEWDPVHTPTGGTFAAAFAGREQVVDGAGFWRYGADVQQLVRLGVGPRVLVLGVHGEAITASPDAVPFVELPALGGPLFLRGFAPDRFRDRIAAAGTLGYRWDLARWIEAQAFVDAGRVYGALDALTLSGLRVGYGLGLDLGHGAGRIDIASSLDDGTFIGIWLNPLRDLDTRGRPR